MAQIQGMVAGSANEWLPEAQLNAKISGAAEDHRGSASADGGNPQRISIQGLRADVDRDRPARDEFARAARGAGRDRAGERLLPLLGGAAAAAVHQS